MNSSTPMVSVIIAFLNEELFLSEAVDSVLQQTYTDWELLLVDDGSTDSSTAIAKDYAAKYPGKIFYVEHEGHANKGLCISRNLGLSKARGSLIAIFDADDLWLPEKLAQQVAIFEKDPEIGMVAEASKYWHSWHESENQDVTVQVGPDQDRAYDPPQLMPLIYPLGNTSAPCPSGLMIKKKALVAVGGFEEAFTKNKYQLYEDQAFLSKLYLNEKVYISSQCNNLYRQRATSIVHWVHADGQYHTVRKYFLEWLEAYLKEHEVKAKQVKSALDKALLRYRHPIQYWLIKVLPIKVKNTVVNRLYTFKNKLIPAK